MTRSTGMAPRPAIGIDVGGTTVKGALIDLAAPHLPTTLLRASTPSPALVGDVLDVVADLVRQLASMPGSPGLGRLPVGVALSGDVRDGQHTSGVNLHGSWVGAPAREMLESRLGVEVRILNDADAAGLAEVDYGAARGVSGVVVVLTFGTGIGSAVFLDGRLLPNTCFGQLPFRGADCERSLSAVARERRGIGWQAWAAELNELLALVDGLLRPDLVLIGGGASEAWPEYERYLDTPCRVQRARFGNGAGVIGAADFAAAARRE